MALVDTHCHLNLDAFKEDLQAVIDRAAENGIERILVPGIDLETSRLAVALAEQHPNLFAAVGVHPNDASTWDAESSVRLRELAAHTRVVALGEIGLDYYRDYASPALQRQILKEQLALAGELGLPVVLHNRDALADLWPILMEWQNSLEASGSPLASRPGVLHSYDGDLETALTAARQNFFIGISGPVTFRNAPERQHITARLPLSSILLETDAPFLAPHPRRGRRNEPAYVQLIAEKVAALHQITIESLSSMTTENADRLFFWRALS